MLFWSLNFFYAFFFFVKEIGEEKEKDYEKEERESLPPILSIQIDSMCLKFWTSKTLLIIKV